MRMTRGTATNLQDSELMHLPRTRGDHPLQDGELLVHLRSPPPLDEAVSRLPRYLPPRRTRSRRLLLLRPSRSCRSALRGPRRSGLLCIAAAFRAAGGGGWDGFALVLLGARLHLDDLSRARRRRREGELVLRRRVGRGSPAGLDRLAGLHSIWRSGR